jgi:hypothetical protein
MRKQEWFILVLLIAISSMWAYNIVHKYGDSEKTELTAEKKYVADTNTVKDVACDSNPVVALDSSNLVFRAVWMDQTIKAGDHIKFEKHRINTGMGYSDIETVAVKIP